MTPQSRFPEFWLFFGPPPKRVFQNFGFFFPPPNAFPRILAVFCSPPKRVFRYFRVGLFPTLVFFPPQWGGFYILVHGSDFTVRGGGLAQKETVFSHNPDTSHLRSLSFDRQFHFFEFRSFSREKCVQS